MFGTLVGIYPSSFSRVGLGIQAVHQMCVYILV